MLPDSSCVNTGPTLNNQHHHHHHHHHHHQQQQQQQHCDKINHQVSLDTVRHTNLLTHLITLVTSTISKNVTRREKKEYPQAKKLLQRYRICREVQSYQSEKNRRAKQRAYTNPEPCQVVLDRAYKNQDKKTTQRDFTELTFTEPRNVL